MPSNDILSPLLTDMKDGQNLDSIDISSPRALRMKYLLKLARVNARGLPSLSDVWQLLMPFLALERGDGIPLENYIDSYLGAFQEFGGRVQRKARELRVDSDDLEKRLLGNVVYILSVNRQMTLYEAINLYFNSISTAHFEMASERDQDTAGGQLLKELIPWLRMNGIPFSIKPPINIPSTTITTLLQPFKGLPDFYVGDEIPPQKLANAVVETFVPSDETVAALIDCTFFGSAKDCVLFGLRAIYFKNGGINNFLPYSEFPDVVFFSQSNSSVKYDFGLISLDGSSFQADRLSEALEIIKRQAIKMEPSEEADVVRGLSTIPGMAELKQMLQEEVVDPIQDPERFKKYKIEIPNGILLYGPPGCGKTFVARRLATELNYNFYEVSPSVVGSSYIHETATKIRKLFDEAAKNSPALMFVDEFEGLVPARRTLGGEQQFKAEEVNEWLVQIGSCAQRKILFVAATNEPWGIDDAVQRSGRLDKKVYVGPPDTNAIAEMLLHHLGGRPFTSAQAVVDFSITIAEQGYSASDLKLLVDEAAKLAMRTNQDISPAHLTMAAAEKVPPSISREMEQTYLSFKEQRKTTWATS